MYARTPKTKAPARRYLSALRAAHALEPLEPRTLLSASPTPAQAVAQSDNQFAFDLFSELATSSAGGNVFFSPYSIATALQMALQGANGQTAAQMIQALHLPSTDIAQAGIQALNQLFQANAATAGYTLSTANRLWVQQNFQLLQSFLDSEQSTFGAAPQSVDFSDPTAAAATINAWVSAQTNGKIPELISPAAIDDLTRLIITNAIYFKGTWLDSFNPSATQQTNFTTSPGQTAPVQMMNQLNDFGYYAQSGANGFQAIDLPYEGNNLDMLVILPTDPNLADFDPAFTPDLLNQITSNLQDQNVNLFLPRFELSTGYDLGSDLQNLGMTGAFSDYADFSGITDSEPLQISDVIHKAYIQVDEQGSEAAAATGIGMSQILAISVEPPPLPVLFDADHPFLIAIRDRSTGTILFMGQITNPGNDTDGETPGTGTNPPGFGPVITFPSPPPAHTPLQPPTLSPPNASGTPVLIVPPSSTGPATTAASGTTPQMPAVPAGFAFQSPAPAPGADPTPQIPISGQPAFDGSGAGTVIITGGTLQVSSSGNASGEPTSTLAGDYPILFSNSSNLITTTITLSNSAHSTTPILVIAPQLPPAQNPITSPSPIITLGTNSLNTGGSLITVLNSGSLTGGTLTNSPGILITGTENVNGTIVLIESNGSTLTLT